MTGGTDGGKTYSNWDPDLSGLTLSLPFFTVLLVKEIVEQNDFHRSWLPFLIKQDRFQTLKVQTRTFSNTISYSVV